MRTHTQAVAIVGLLPLMIGACALMGRGATGRRPGSDLVLPVRPQPQLMLQDGRLACASLPFGPVRIIVGGRLSCAYTRLDSIAVPIPRWPRP